MNQSIKTIAILSQSIAYSSILHMVLASNIQFRVRIFNDEQAVIDYNNISPIDLLIYDCDQIDSKIITFIHNLRHMENVANPKFQIITLCKTISKGIRSICKTVGIDEVIIKPMSPTYLETRVLVRLTDNSTKLYRGIDRRKKEQISNRKTNLAKNHDENHNANNVIPLFGSKNTPPPPSQLN